MRGGIVSVMIVAGAVVGCARNTGGDLVWRATADEASRVRVEAEGERVVVEVWSGSGIGHAHVEASDRHRGREVLLRLHLQGLEKLRLDYGKVVELSISSSPPYTGRCELISGATAASPIDPTSPYWMPVRLLAADGGPGRIPLDGGTIEVGLPRDFVAGKNRSFDFEWIDFYR